MKNSVKWVAGLSVVALVVVAVYFGKSSLQTGNMFNFSGRQLPLPSRQLPVPMTVPAAPAGHLVLTSNMDSSTHVTATQPDYTVLDFNVEAQVQPFSLVGITIYCETSNRMATLDGNQIDVVDPNLAYPLNTLAVSRTGNCSYGGRTIYFNNPLVIPAFSSKHLQVAYDTTNLRSGLTAQTAQQPLLFKTKLINVLWNTGDCIKNASVCSGVPFETNFNMN